MIFTSLEIIMAKKKISLAAAAGNADAASAFVGSAPDAKPLKEKFKRVNFDLDIKAHADLKILAIQRGMSIKDLLISLIDKELKN